MSMASQVSFPSGGRLGRRPRAMPHLLAASMLALALAAGAISLAAIAAHSNPPEHAKPFTKKVSIIPPKIVQSALAANVPAAPAAASSAIPPQETSALVASRPSNHRPAAATPSPASAAIRAASPLSPRKANAIPIDEPAVVASHPAGAARRTPAVVASVPMPLPSAAVPREASVPVEQSSVKAPAPASASARVAAAHPEVPSARAIPVRQKPKPAPAKPASAHSPVESHAASGPLFAAYLTSSSEAQARKQLVPLQKKYATELRGRHLNYHRMRVGGVVVYRVRVAKLSKADANALCQKLQAVGAPCDVGPN